MAYIYNADIYCDECGREIKASIKAELPAAEWQQLRDDGDSDGWPQGPYPDGGGEADCPQHCGNCREFLENPLTTDGMEYVKQAVREHDEQGTGDGEVISLWRSYYDIADDEADEE